MSNVLNFNNLQLAVELGGSFGMLALTIGALIYTVRSQDRVQSGTNLMIFSCLIIAFIFNSALSMYDLRNRQGKLSDSEKFISNILYAFQFIFQWLSLFIFTLEYLSTEQEVRKVLGMKATKRKREIYCVFGVIFLLLAVLFTYLICRWSGESFWDSWASSLGEAGVAGVLLILQGRFIQQISTLINEANLDLVPVRRTFCANLSCVGFIFLVQCGDVTLHLITNIFLNKTKKEQQDANSTTFLILAIGINVCLLIAYFSFFLLIFRSTKAGRTFEDLILHKNVPELVYLQTRKLLRDTHFQKAEKHRDDYWDTDSIVEAKSMRSDAPKVQIVPTNDKLDDTDQFLEERKLSQLEINTYNGTSPETNRLSMSHGVVEMIKTHEMQSKSQALTESQKVGGISQTLPDQKSASSMSPNNILQKPASKKHTFTNNSEAQSFYTAQESPHLVAGQSSSNRKTESDFMSALESNTPYQEIPGEPPKPSSLPLSKVSSMRSSSQHNSITNKLVTIKESVDERELSRYGGGLIEEGNSEDEEGRLDKMSTESEAIREQANRILQIYNMRLNKVGPKPFQIRLNIFFTFVKSTSVEAEAYDYLQSVDGSVMNHSDDSGIIERMHERTSSRLSVVSNYLSNLSD